MTLDASTPFMAIAVGDILNPYAWGGGASGTLRAVRVEHILWEPPTTPKFPDRSPAHKVCVYTEAQA